MGCCYTFLYVDTIEGLLTNYEYDTYDTNIFIDNRDKTTIVLHKSNPDYVTLLEKIKKLKGKTVTITYDIFLSNYKHVIDIEEFNEREYSGKIRHIVGLAQETQKSANFEIIFENPKYDHIFIMDRKFYKSHKDILEVGSEYTIEYELYEGNWYKVIKITKIDKPDDKGYFPL